MQFQKTIRKSSWFLALAFLAVSCMVPTSKESYLEKFENFVNRVEKEHENYNKKDWIWADKQFEKFSDDWYNEYREEMTWEEKLRVKMIILKYKTIKGEEDLDSGIKKFMKEDAKELREEIEEYLENDAEEDLEKLREGMEEIGDSAVKVFEDIVRSFKNMDD